MKAILLAFALLTIIARADKSAPACELFLVESKDVVKITVTDQNEWQKLDVKVTQTCATNLQAFSQRNLGKRVGIALLQMNKDGSGGQVHPTWVTLGKPITDGIAHLVISNPNPRAHHEILIAE